MAMLADALDHVEWKAGFRADGFSMSVYTIIFTVCAGLAQALELLPDDDLAREAAPLARFLRRTGGVFAFDPASAVRSLALGRADALRILDDNHGFFR